MIFQSLRVFFYSAMQIYGLQISREAVEVHRQGKSLNLTMLIQNVSSLIFLTTLIITTIYGYMHILPLLGSLLLAGLFFHNYLIGAHFSQVLSPLVMGIVRLEIPIISTVISFCIGPVAFYAQLKRDDKIIDFEEQWEMPEWAPGIKYPKLLAMSERLIRSLPYIMIYLIYGVIAYQAFTLVALGKFSFALSMYTAHLFIAEIHHHHYLPGFASTAWIELCRSLTQLTGLFSSGVVGAVGALVTMIGVISSKVGAGLRDWCKMVILIVTPPSLLHRIKFIFDSNDISAAPPQKKSEISKKVGLARNAYERMERTEELYIQPEALIQEAKKSQVKPSPSLNSVFYTVNSSHKFKLSSVIDRLIRERDERIERASILEKHLASEKRILADQKSKKSFIRKMGSGVMKVFQFLYGAYLRWAIVIPESFICLLLTPIVYVAIKSRFYSHHAHKYIVAQQPKIGYGGPLQNATEAIVTSKAGWHQGEMHLNESRGDLSALAHSLYRRETTQVMPKLLRLTGIPSPDDPYQPENYHRFKVAPSFEQLATSLVGYSLDPASISRDNGGTENMEPARLKYQVFRLVERLNGRPYLRSWANDQISGLSGDDLLQKLTTLSLGGVDYNLFDLSDEQRLAVIHSCSLQGVNLEEVYNLGAVEEMLGVADPQKTESIVSFILLELKKAIDGNDQVGCASIIDAIASAATVCPAGLAGHWYSLIHSWLTPGNTLDAQFGQVVFDWKNRQFDLLYTQYLSRLSSSSSGRGHNTGPVEELGITEPAQDISIMMSMVAHLTDVTGGNRADTHKATDHVLKHWEGFTTKYNVIANQDVVSQLPPASLAMFNYFSSYPVAYYMTNNDWRPFVSELNGPIPSGESRHGEILRLLRDQSIITGEEANNLTPANLATIQKTLVEIERFWHVNRYFFLSGIDGSVGNTTRQDKMLVEVNQAISLLKDSRNAQLPPGDVKDLQLEAYNTLLYSGALDYDIVMQYMLDKGYIAKRENIELPSVPVYLKRGIKKIVTGIFQDGYAGLKFVLSKLTTIVWGLILTPNEIRKKYAPKNQFWKQALFTIIAATISLGFYFVPVSPAIAPLLALRFDWLTRSMMISIAIGWSTFSFGLRSMKVSRVKGTVLKAAVLTGAVELSLVLGAAMSQMLTVSIVSAYALYAAIALPIMLTVAYFMSGVAMVLMDALLTKVAQGMLLMLKLPYLVGATSVSVLSSILKVRSNIKSFKTASSIASEVFSDCKAAVTEIRNDIKYGINASPPKA